MVIKKIIFICIKILYNIKNKIAKAVNNGNQIAKYVIIGIDVMCVYILLEKCKKLTPHVFVKLVIMN